MCCCALMHDGHVPQESSLSPGEEDNASSNKAGGRTCAALPDVQTIYWAKARAIARVPLPSLPKNNRAWLNLLLTTRSIKCFFIAFCPITVSYTHLRAHETPEHLVCRLLLEK